MSESNGEPHAPTPARAPIRGQALLAWIAIVAIVLGVINQNLPRPAIAGETGKGTPNLLLREFLSKIYVAAPEASKASGEANVRTTRENMAQRANELNHGNLDERLTSLIALADLAGPKFAVQGIDQIVADAKKANIDFSPTDKLRIDILTRLYTDYVDKRPSAPTVSPDERASLITAYGWLGELALAPERPDAPPDASRKRVLAEANATLTAFVFFIIFIVAVAGVGVVGLFLMAILALRGRWKSQLGTAVPYHAIYAETFALWLAALFALLRFLPPLTSAFLPFPLIASLAMILSLGMLAWPVWRGIAWKQVRQDIGLTLGTQPLLEPIYGVTTYINTMPIGLVGGIVTLMLLFGLAPKPSEGNNPFVTSPMVAHPVLQQLAKGSPSDILPYFVLLSVCAPIVEEVFFRGVLYRHLRDATRAWKIGAFASMVVVSLIFAAVHPQGIVAIPALAALGFGYNLTREWRGTLLPGMIAHGINNAVALAFATYCL